MAASWKPQTEIQTPIHQTSYVATTLVCNQQQHGGRQDRRLKTKRWLRTRKLILARDHWTCGYCGAPANTVDHRVPRSVGGAMYQPDNLVACCDACQNSGERRRRQLALARSMPADKPMVFVPITGELTKRG
jgi:5-methylcytosine-specific restriction endonuclease McrA